VTKYSTVGTDIASLVYWEFYEDGTCQYTLGENIYTGTYTNDEENNIINLSYEEDGEAVEKEFTYTTIGDNNVIYYSYYVEKYDASYIEIYSDNSTDGIFDTIGNVRYSYQTDEGYKWYINFEEDEIYWSTEDVEQGNLSSGWLNGRHYKYFYFIDGYIYEYDSESYNFISYAKISDNGATLEQYMYMNRGYDGTWEKVAE